MNTCKVSVVACAVGAILGGTSALAVEMPVDPAREIAAPEGPVKRPQHAKPTSHAVTAASQVELTAQSANLNSGFGTKSAFAMLAPSPDSTTLSPPVTLTYSGGSPVLFVNNSGGNKGVESVINNPNNSTSALYGLTNGSGAGLTGYNSGTVGPAGKFGITNAASSEPAVTATTNGGGSGLIAVITKSQSEAPAILGQNLVTSNYGTGVEGDGDDFGVEGYGSFSGVFGNGDTYGVWGFSSSGTGVYGESVSGTGVYGFSDSSYGTYSQSDTGIGLYSYSRTNTGVSAISYSGTGLYANNITSGHGITAHSGGGIGLYASSDTGYGVFGQSTNTYGVIGEDSGSGIGVYGFSAAGYAGFFQGKVGATSYVTLSDRNSKTRIKPVDGHDILARIDRLPVESWVFKTDLDKKHVGPMAQDFHAAFGLDGDDDKHINLTDIAGVSLAAIKELSATLKLKDAEIAVLKQQLKSMDDTYSARMTALEQHQRRFDTATQTVSLRRVAGALDE